MARIVFDLDGTLIDSAPDLHAIANALLAKEGSAPITLEHARDFIGNGAAVFVQRMREARGIADSEQDRLLADFIARYDDAVDLTVPYPAVPETLALLSGAGHALGVCTNKPISPTRAVLSHLGLDRHFGIILGGDSLPKHKPDPAPLHAAFEALGSGPEIYVGDSEVDAETARRACVPFLLFTEGYLKVPATDLSCTATFSDFTNLPALVARTIEEAA